MVTIPVSCGKVRYIENKLTMITDRFPFRVSLIKVWNKNKTEPHQHLLYNKGQKKVPNTRSLKYNRVLASSRRFSGSKRLKRKK